METIPTDLTQLIAGLLGVSTVDLGTSLLIFVMISTIAGLIAPYLSSNMPKWKASAVKTKTTTDDKFIRILGGFLFILLLIIQVASWIVPRFKLGLDQAKEELNPEESTDSNDTDTDTDTSNT